MSTVINGSITELVDGSYTFGGGGTSLLANCVNGFGPTGQNTNNILGGWYLNGRQITHQGCNYGGVVTVVDNEYAGISQLHQCETFTTAVEGVYLCEMFDSAFEQHSERLGVYLNGRSKLLIMHQ